MRISLNCFLVFIFWSALAHSALLVNHSQNQIDYLLQVDCQQIVESGSIPAKTSKHPVRIPIGHAPGTPTSDEPTWCLTLSLIESQKPLGVIKLGDLGDKCGISIMANNLNIIVSEACKSPT